MLFLSIPFLVFFPAFFLLYWGVFNRRLKAQNFLVLAASYGFYAWWDWRFLLLLAGSSALSYVLGIMMGRTGRDGYQKGDGYRKGDGFQKLLVGIGLVQGLGCLLYFKYFNPILPLGISFYTFKTISYLLDIRRGKIGPERDWVVFFSYIAFFPCITSGPIDRPGHLIPQLKARRVFEYGQAADGMRQVLWGLFKKIVIADNAAVFSDEIFRSYRSQPASALLYGVFIFTIRIYADFSSYSDIAIGASRLLGFDISRNFNYPFFARNIAEFWRKWHITLTSWMTDYVYTPLSISFRNLGRRGVILAILINFIAIGAWHGPRWTFVLFGFLHGLYYVPLILRRTVNKKRGPIHMVWTFLLVMLTFVVFKADNLAEAFDYYRRMLSPSLFSRFPIFEKVNTAAMLAGILVMFGAEWRQRDKKHALELSRVRQWGVRALIYCMLILVILTFGPTKNADFIYLNF
ncbi:MAG TPA: MBOAT family O-acyltransferase [Puia sp.]|jgi:D-alanyl-lipoteichoic acid acyltransferase DltB (MBOAT superfamily)|nr:MBOAT family O-acyltransferase [Puia sp.]